MKRRTYIVEKLRVRMPDTDDWDDKFASKIYNEVQTLIYDNQRKLEADLNRLAESYGKRPDSFEVTYEG